MKNMNKDKSTQMNKYFDKKPRAEKIPNNVQ